MDKRLALIDLDTILYLVAYKQFDAGNRDRPDAVIAHVKEFVNTILINTKVSHYYMVYQVRGHTNFRKYFYPDYKANRPEDPEFIVLWKDTILETFRQLGAVGVTTIESDDAVCIANERFKDLYTIVVVSADKDLAQVAGEHYNPRLHKTFFVSQSEAELNLNIQILGGDASDGVTGIKGIGAKWDTKTDSFAAPKALKILSNPAPKACFEAYKEMYGDTWYSEYSKTKFLVELLKELTPEAEIIRKEVSPLIDIRKASDLVITNLFE